MAKQLADDISGQSFGSLLAIEHLGKGVWRCLCESCGLVTNVKSRSLRNKFNKGKSCGGLLSRPAHGNRTHGHSGENSGPEYRAWKAIRSRCTREKSDHFVWYGGKGIKVCERWNKRPWRRKAA